MDAGPGPKARSGKKQKGATVEPPKVRALQPPNPTPQRPLRQKGRYRRAADGTRASAAQPRVSSRARLTVGLVARMAGGNRAWGESTEQRREWPSRAGDHHSAQHEGPLPQGGSAQDQGGGAVRHCPAPRDVASSEPLHHPTLQQRVRYRKTTCVCSRRVLASCCRPHLDWARLMRARVTYAGISYRSCTASMEGLLTRSLPTV